MKILLKKVITDNQYTHFDLLIPVDQQGYVTDSVTGLQDPVPPDVVINHCCKAMETNYKDTFRLTTRWMAPDNAVPSMALIEKGTESWGEEYTNYLEINFCPFCGQKFEYEVVRTVKQHRKTVAREVYDLEIVEEVVPNEQA